MTDHDQMYQHFARLAVDYRQVRTTDIEPIKYIASELGDVPEVKAADIGCGAGRYDLLLFQNIPNLHLTCVDINLSMLQEAERFLRRHQITDFRILRSAAETVPLRDASLHCVVSFNAVHHFSFNDFLRNCARMLKPGGSLFIYTRTRTQNSRSIWGRYFPEFCQKENRLFELEEMECRIAGEGSLRLLEARAFKYPRSASLGELVGRARARHYSTFSLYGEQEFERALAGFEANLRAAYNEITTIEWCDENLLLNVRKD